MVAFFKLGAVASHIILHRVTSDSVVGLMHFGLLGQTAVSSRLTMLPLTDLTTSQMVVRGNSNRLDTTSLGTMLTLSSIRNQQIKLVRRPLQLIHSCGLWPITVGQH